MMIAHARYLRMSPRKIRLVANLIRGMAVSSAETQLMMMRKAAAQPLWKTLKSAVANAIDQYDSNVEDLVIASVTVDGAPMLKRWRPRAFGRASPIHKHGAHITITLKSTKPLKRREGKQLSATVAASEAPKASRERVDHEARVVGGEAGSHAADISDPRKMGSRHEPSHVKPVQKKSKGFLKKLFSRKTG